MEFTAMISSQLLPLAYSFDPNLVVIRSLSSLCGCRDRHHKNPKSNDRNHQHNHQGGIRYIGNPTSRTFSTTPAAGNAYFGHFRSKKTLQVLLTISIHFQSLATGRLVLVIAGNPDEQRRKSFAEKLLAGY